VAKAKHDLPTGQAYASAPDSAPTPPVKPQAVAELEQPNLASDAASDVPAGPKLIAPLPPRKPADFAALAFAGAPMPPTRPADLILASKTDQGAAAFVLPSNKGFGPAWQRGLLPQVITSGVDRAPTGALALAEALSAPKYNDDTLLARAAELTAPLPPMPIASAGAAVPDKTMAVADASAVQPEQHGWVARTAAVAAEDIAQLFGGVFTTSSPAHASPDELGETSQ
jgi:hypothetical protein